MALVDSFLFEAARSNVWIANRSDRIHGTGSAQDPLNGTTQQAPAIPISLTVGSSPPLDREATVDTGATLHGFVNGDMVLISGVTGDDADIWNGTFGIYGVSDFTFKYLMKKPPAPFPPGNPICVRLTFRFDEVMRQLPTNIQIRLGPGTYQTRGFAPNDSRGWQPRSGQKIVGAGVEVTTLQLVGAENADQHYHAVGMSVEPSDTTPIVPLESFEVSGLTIDCNADNQPGRPYPGYASVACGAVRIIGNHCRVSRVKAMNWGTKSLHQGCFVISIIDASAKPTDAAGQPVLTETVENGIEDCIAIQPSKENARETTVLHVGGLKNPQNQAQGFGRGPFIRRNFVDCQFFTSVATSQVPTAFSSAFISSKGGTGIVGSLGTFVGKRPHFRNALDVRSPYLRFYNPRDPASRWNGYFQINSIPAADTLEIIVGTAPPNTTNDSSLVVMGTEFRAIAMSSCVAGVVEDNQIHNCWIGGPYQSILDDTVTDPTVPPTLVGEERLDPLNALNTRELVVRNNVYRNVAAGPYWNMGGVSGAVSLESLVYDLQTGKVTATTAPKHRLWRGARVFIEGTADTRYRGLQRILRVTDTTFQYALAPNLEAMQQDTGTYRVVSGVDFLVVEGNLIELADLDETEFAIKEYPLAASPALQTYRACGIVIGDNGLSAKGGPYAHGLVIIRHNKLRYPDGLTASVQTGIGRPAGSGVQITGARQVHLTGNGLNLNARNPGRTFRCGKVYVFNNQRPGGPVVPVWNGDMNGHYDEPETVAEDAFILSLFKK